MGTALTTTSKGRGVAVIDYKNLNHDMAKAWADKEAAGRRVFAGEQIKFNGQDGEWKQGFGDNAKILKDRKRFVANYAHTTIAWQEWSDDAPNYMHVGMVFAGATLPARSELGFTDKSEWKDDKYNKGEKIDPCKKVTILFVRDEKGTKMSHIMADNISASMTIAKLISECIDEGKRKPGMLPVIELSCGEKVKKPGKNFYPPSLEIVDWVKAIAMDQPESGMLEAVAEVDEEDEGEVTSKSRTKSKAKAKARDEDEDEDDDEEDNDPRKGNKGKDISKQPDDDEDEDEDEDDEDDRPAKSKVKPSKAKSRRKDDDEDEDEDDEDEDDEPVKRRRLK